MAGAALRMTVAMLACLFSSSAIVFAQGDSRKVLILTPKKAISLQALKNFEISAGNQEASATATLEKQTLFPIRVRSGDTFERIVYEQWGLLAGKDYVADALIKEVLALPSNATIAARPGKLSAIQPGDTLYFPSTIAGMRKVGSIAVSASTNADPDALLKSAFHKSPQPYVQEAKDVTIARLSKVGECGEQQGTFPFDSGKLLDRIRLSAKRSPPGAGGLDGRIIAVIDAGLQGTLDPLTPFIAKPTIQPDQYESQGGAFIPTSSGLLTDLISKTDPKSEHGTHVMTLVLGGESRLGQAADAWPRGPWGLVPIVVESGRLLGNGTKEAEIQPSWIGDALSYAKERRAKIVNISLEAQRGDFIAINMRARYDTLFVVAAGNGNLSIKQDEGPPVKAIDYFFVGSQPRQFHVIPGMMGGPNRGHIISVAAHTDTQEMAAFSGRYERNVDIAAPGVCIRSYTSLGSSFADSEVHGMTGTSQAAAVVSYAASLVADLMGPFTPGEIKARLLATSIYDARNYMGLLSSRGRLSVESAVALRFDIVRYRESGQLIEEVGDFDNLPGNTDPISKLHICDKPPTGEPPIKIGDIWKAIPSGSGLNAKFEYIRRKKVSLMTAENQDDPFDWTWMTCVANWGNVNKIAFRRFSDGKILTIRFEDLVELIPRHYP